MIETWLRRNILIIMARVACVSALDSRGLDTNVLEVAAGITTIVTGDNQLEVER